MAGGGRCACELGQIREEAAVADTRWVAASVSLYLAFYWLLLLGVLWRISFLHSVKMVSLVFSMI